MLLHKECLIPQLQQNPEQLVIAAVFNDCNGDPLTPGAQLAKCSDIPAAPTLTLSGQTLSISGGNYVTLHDSDAQQLSINGNVVSLTNGGSITLPATAAPVPQELSIYNDILTLSGGGGSVQLPDLDMQTLDLQGNTLTISGGNSVTLPIGADVQQLSLSGNTLSLTNGGSVTLPAAAAPVFATPAEAQAGTSTTLHINPADLYARENIAAQTGVSNDIAEIPAPAAGQSPWASNALGETLHYAPGLGWKIVSDLYGTSTGGSATALTPNVLTPITGSSLTLPRRGKIAVAVNGLMTAAAASAGDFGFGITLNGVLFATHRIFYTSPVDEYQDFLQTVLAGYVNPGDVLAFVAITSASGFTMTLPTIRYQYVS
jgi:hypothetical protein